MEPNLPSKGPASAFNLCGILLAAGRSSRFGDTDKLLYPIGGKPMVRHAADALRQAGCTHHIAVVSSTEVASLLTDFEIACPAPDRGQSESLRVGLERASDLDCSHVLIALGDMPNVSVRLLNRIVDTARAFGAAASVFGSKRCPPACFQVSRLEDLTFPDSDSGARHVLAGLEERHLVVASEAELKDIDEAADLARYK